MRTLSIGLAALLISTSAYAQQSAGADRGGGMAGRAGAGGSESSMRSGADRSG